MKKLLLIAASLVLVAATAFGQAKKPSLMVIPSNVWCSQNGYMNEIDVQGQTIFSPDYSRALSNDADLTLVISKIGGLFIEDQVMAPSFFCARNVVTLIALLAAVAMYLFALFFTHSIRKQDILSLPMGEKIAKVLEKRGIIG